MKIKSCHFFQSIFIQYVLGHMSGSILGTKGMQWIKDNLRGDDICTETMKDK